MSVTVRIGPLLPALALLLGSAPLRAQNQQFLDAICSATVGITSQLDPTARAINIFTAPAPMRQTGSPRDLIFSEPLSAAFAGEPDFLLHRFLNEVIISASGGRVMQVQGAIPYRALNRDNRLIFDDSILPPELTGRRTGHFGDGINSHTNTASFNRTPFCLTGIFGPNPDPNCLPDFVQDPIDWLSLDSTLSSQQRALLGCGPFFGTRCDSSNRRPDPLDPTLPDTFGFGGGIDFLNMEASVLVQAWPGFEGTGVVGLNGCRGGPWTTTDKRLIQPGRVGRNEAGNYVAFDGGPVATRVDPLTGQTRVLPGARGVATPDDLARAGLARDTPVLVLAPDETVITVTFQEGYDPIIDGCVFGTSIGGIPLAGVEVGSGAPVDLAQCGSSADSVPGVVTVESSSRARLTASGGTDLPASAVRQGSNPQVAANVGELLRDASVGQQVRLLDGAQTLYHPLAGCFDDPTGADAGVPCGDLVMLGPAMGFERDYEAELLAVLRGTAAPGDRIASVFQSELAAVSWNALMFLVITSCSGATDGPVGSAEREARPECFTTGSVVDGDAASGLKEWQPDRCGFAAPHLCRNVQALSHLFQPEVRRDVDIRVVAGGGGQRGWHRRRPQTFHVTVLGSDLVNVDHLDLATLRFGPADAAPRHDLTRRRDYRWHARDVNRDGARDLVLHFRSREAGLSRQDHKACLAGQLDGQPFLSCQEIRSYESRGRRGPASARPSGDSERRARSERRRDSERSRATIR